MRKLGQHSREIGSRKPKGPYGPYRNLLSRVVRLIEQARLAAVRSVNVALTSTYWLVGQRIVEHEQSGSERAAYGQLLVKRLAQDLTAQLGRGFSERNLEQMRSFYLGWPPCPAPFTSGCTPLRIPKHEGTTSARRCKAAGRSANLTARSPVSPISGPVAQNPSRPRKRRYRPTRTFGIRSSSSS